MALIAALLRGISVERSRARAYAQGTAAGTPQAARVALRQLMVVYLSWLGVLVFVLGCVASEALPFAWFTPSVLPTVLVEAELAFLLLLWPLFLPRVLAEANPQGGFLRDLRTVCLQLIALAIFATPLAVLCAAAGRAEATEVFRMQGYPLGLAVGLGLMAAGARRTRRDPVRGYYLVLLLLSGALPLAGFVLRDVGGSKGIACFSPFYAPLAGGPSRSLLVGAMLLGGAACSLWPRPSSSRASA